MGFKIEVERDDVEGTTVQTYKCSNCDVKILVAAAIRFNETYEINWASIPPFCPCGEKLITPITKLVPIIDQIERVTTKEDD